MNKVELLNYIHWFSLKTQFKNTSGSVLLRLHNLNMTRPYMAEVAGGYGRPFAQLFLTLVSTHLLASSRLWYQRALKRWLKVMRLTFAGGTFLHLITTLMISSRFCPLQINTTEIFKSMSCSQPQWHSWYLIIGSEYLHCDWISLLSFECDCQITEERAEQEGSSDVSITTHQSVWKTGTNSCDSVHWKTLYLWTTWTQLRFNDSKIRKLARRMPKERI